MSTDDLDRAFRRAEARNSRSPKRVDELLRNIPIHQHALKVKENLEMRKAYCKRLAGRETVIGNTVFKFDKDGICKFKNTYVSTCFEDFDKLCQMNGVKDITNEPTEPVVQETKPVENLQKITNEVLVQSSVSIELTTTTDSVTQESDTQQTKDVASVSESVVNFKEISKPKKGRPKGKKDTTIVEDIKSELTKGE